MTYSRAAMTTVGCFFSEIDHINRPDEVGGIDFSNFLLHGNLFHTFDNSIFGTAEKRNGQDFNVFLVSIKHDKIDEM